MFEKFIDQTVIVVFRTAAAPYNIYYQFKNGFY